MGDGSKPVGSLFDSLMKVGKRVLTGESIFMTHFTNQGQGKKRVAFAAPYPGKIIPLEMAQVGEELICQKDAFLCAALGTSIEIAFQRKLGTGFFGGEGFILQRLRGDGKAFIHVGGTVIKKSCGVKRCGWIPVAASIFRWLGLGKGPGFSSGRLR